MPYIDPWKRTELSGPGQGFRKRSPESPGELNYVLTCVLFEYYSRMGRGYGSINDILGALEGAKLEFYRRVGAPYEDIKMQENGDVY